MTIKHDVERYVTLKRQLGYKYENEERRLQSYVHHAESQGDSHIRTDTIVDWSQQATSTLSVQRRYDTVRKFAVWLHAEDERHEIPPRDVFGRIRPKQRSPQLLTLVEIGRLLEAALTLPPIGSITPHTYHYMFGLMAATGLRRSEAISLRMSDITPDGLVIRETKFRKTRLVPLHDSVQDAIERYLDIRRRIGGHDDHLFVLSTGRPPSPTGVTNTYISLARQIGLRGGPGTPGPRLHDLRHGFAVRSLEQAVGTNRQSVDRHTLALSTYLGHVGVSSTYWYLHATPALLKHIAEAAEEAHGRRRDDD